MILVILSMVAAVALSEPLQPTGMNDSSIVVTGERVKRSLKETQSSVAVFDKREMERLAAPDRINQILQLVPNVLVPTSRDTPTIRGQSGVGVLQGLPAFLGGARPRTVMQIDGRTVTFNELVNSTEGLWDVDRVEVFRSPQTTTQGVNSIAGAIFLRTADPSFGFEGRARLIGGNWQRRQASALVSGPIVAEQLSFRLSGDFYRAHPSTTMSGPIEGVDLNVDRYWTTRAKLLAEPAAVPGLKVLAIYAHTHSQAPQGEGARPPFRERRDDDYRFGYFKSDVDSGTSAITYSLSDTIESRTTLSFGSSQFRRFAPQGFGQTRIHAHDASAETVIEWRPGPALRAVGGASFQQLNIRQFIDLSITGLGTGSFKDRQRSAGAFGDLNWQPSDRLTLSAGARYQTDSRNRAGLLQTTPRLSLDYDKTSRAFLPKISLAYDLTSAARLGAMVQRAYNPGGVTLDPAHHAQIEFKPEYLWDYEVFIRTDLFGGLARFNANAFYNDLHDTQRELDFDLSSPGGNVGLLQIISEPRARTYGAELELSGKIASRLAFQAAVGLLRTRITRGIAPNDPFAGREFAGAPHFTGSASINWKAVRNVEVSLQARHNSGYWGDDNNDPFFRTSGWSIVDARASWKASRFTVFGYAQNLFDKLRILGYAGPRDDPEAEVELTDPREVGIGIDASF